MNLSIDEAKLRTKQTMIHSLDAFHFLHKIQQQNPITSKNVDNKWPLKCERMCVWCLV